LRPQANLLSRTIGGNRNVRSEADALWHSAWGEECVGRDGDFNGRLGSKQASLFALTLRSRLPYVLGSLSALGLSNWPDLGGCWLRLVRQWQRLRYVDDRRDGRCTRGSRVDAPSRQEQKKHRHCSRDGHAARNRRHRTR
jgi:hypothetical protein